MRQKFVFKLEKLDNKTSIGQDFVGNIDIFEFDGVVFYFGHLRSSRVQSIVCTYDDNNEPVEMKVTTKNSVYTFIPFIPKSEGGMR